MSTKLIIDADPGIGDALAIALALHDPALDVLAVTATSGCVSGEVATANVEAIVTTLDPPKWPRLGASDAPAAYVPEELLGESPHPSDLHGADGLGSWLVPEYERHRRHDSEKVLVDLVRQYPDEVTVLTLGSLVNLDRAMQLEPEFPQMLGGLVTLGGAVAVGGDVSPVAEFNIFSAPEEARITLRSPSAKTLVPLDVVSQLSLTFEQFARLEVENGETSVCKLFAELLPYWFRSHHQWLGLESVRIHELVALAAVSRPRLFETSPMAIDIETQGELTRGMTVFDRRDISRWQANIDVVQSVDRRGVLDYVFEMVRGCSS